MNKKLVALAVAGLVASPLAFAQTASVTLYGSFRIQMEGADFKGPSGSARVYSQENVSSRIGFRGTEAISSNLNALFQCETGVGIDTPANSGNWCSREGWVGLSGASWGELKLGYGLTPFDDVLGLAHHQGANSWENINNGVSGGAGFAKQNLFTSFQTTAVNTSAFDARYDNSISYKTPDFKGFTLRTQFAILTETSSNRATGWDTAGIYKNGPITAGLTYADHRNFQGIGNSINGQNDQASWRAYGKYDFGKVAVDATIETAKYKFDAGSSYKYVGWIVGAQAPVGPWLLGAQYSQRDKGLAYLYNASTQSAAAGSLASLANWGQGGGKQYMLTADYNLSKRSLIRGYFSHMENEGTLVSGVMGGKSKINAFSVGLWHHF